MEGSSLSHNYVRLTSDWPEMHIGQVCSIGIECIVASFVQTHMPKKGQFKSDIPVERVTLWACCINGAACCYGCAQARVAKWCIAKESART